MWASRQGLSQSASPIQHYKSMHTNKQKPGLKQASHLITNHLAFPLTHFPEPESCTSWLTGLMFCMPTHRGDSTWRHALVSLCSLAGQERKAAATHTTKTQAQAKAYKQVPSRGFRQMHLFYSQLSSHSPFSCPGKKKRSQMGGRVVAQNN